MNSAGSALRGRTDESSRVDLGQTCSTPPAAARHPIPDGEIAIHVAYACQQKQYGFDTRRKSRQRVCDEGRPRRFALHVGRRFAGREREKVISGVARTLFTCSSFETSLVRNP
jgi:hypothetical protein